MFEADEEVSEPQGEKGIVFKYLTMSRSCDDCQKAWKKRNYNECNKERCCMAAVHQELKQRGSNSKGMS